MERALASAEHAAVSNLFKKMIPFKNTSMTAALSMVVLIFSVTAVIGAGLRSIRGQFNRKEYALAEENLRREIPGMKGKTRDQAMILLASLTTDVEISGATLKEVSESGGKRESLRARLELAKIHYASGEYYHTLNLLEGISSGGRASERYEAVYFRGLARMQLGNLEGARSDFESIDRGNWLHWSHIVLGEIDIRTGKIGNAIERYETIAAGYSSPIAGFRLAECYELTGERNQALQTFTMVARNFPESPEAPKAREKVQMIDASLKRSGDEARGKGGEGRTIPSAETLQSSEGSPSYTLQFGAFSKKENARSFIADLSSMIEGLHIEIAETGGSTWYRVRAGRYATREEAEEAVLAIMERSGYSSKVLPVE